MGVDIYMYMCVSVYGGREGVLNSSYGGFGTSTHFVRTSESVNGERVFNYHPWIERSDICMYERVYIHIHLCVCACVCLEVNR